MQDNSDFFRKIAIRQDLLRRVGRVGIVADCYAGGGEITQILWSHVADKVVCIDKNAAKLASFDCRNAEKHCGDNLELTHLLHECDLFDCDAYGLVMPLIKRIATFAGGKPVVFTDGTPEKGRKLYAAFSAFEKDCRAVFSDYAYERSAAGNAFYGWGFLR
jgi:hypothetical protein